MSGLLNILRNKIFRRCFKAFLISAKSAETKSSECDLSSRERLSGILPCSVPGIDTQDRHGLGKKLGLVNGGALCHHQKELWGSVGGAAGWGTASWGSGLSSQAVSWLDAPLDLCRQHILVPLWIWHCRPGQPHKSVFKVMSLNIEHCWVCASFFPPSPNNIFS